MTMTMNREGRAQAREEQREQATCQATDLIRAYRDDPDAWVRLLVTSGIGDETVYHFDAYWPGQQQDEQARVVVQQVGQAHWEATVVEDALAPSAMSSAG
jgi:hypothetical protein